jgi:hypothetical protein
MSGVRFALLAAVSVAVLGLSASIGSAGTKTAASSGTATTAKNCLAHIIGGLSSDDSDWSEYYTPNCTGHDEPELDPVSSAPGSARDITWRTALPAGGTYSVPSVGPTFWFGGTVKDTNPAKIGGEGFLEMQFYPDSFVKKCAPNGNFNVKHEVGVYTVCSPVWTLAQKPNGNIIEPAAFNGMLMNASGTGPFVMHGRDVVDVHIWAPSMNVSYREQVRDESSGETSGVLVLNSPGDGPLTPEFSKNEIGNALDWGGVWDTPMAFVYEIGHADLYGPEPGAFCVPGETICGSFNFDNWAGQQPIRIFNVTFGDGSHPQNWATVSDTGGKAEVLGDSFVGPTDCTSYGGPYCIYPWYSWDGAAFNYGVNYPNTVDNFGKVNQFAKKPKCPEDGVFAGPTYCDTIIR